MMTDKTPLEKYKAYVYNTSKAKSGHKLTEPIRLLEMFLGKFNANIDSVDLLNAWDDLNRTNSLIDIAKNLKKDETNTYGADGVKKCMSAIRNFYKVNEKWKEGNEDISPVQQAWIDCLKYGQQCINIHTATKSQVDNVPELDPILKELRDTLLNDGCKTGDEFQKICLTYLVMDLGIRMPEIALAKFGKSKDDVTDYPILTEEGFLYVPPSSHKTGKDLTIHDIGQDIYDKITDWNEFNDGQWVFYFGTEDDVYRCKKARMIVRSYCRNKGLFLNEGEGFGVRAIRKCVTTESLKNDDPQTVIDKCKARDHSVSTALKHYDIVGKHTPEKHTSPKIKIDVKPRTPAEKIKINVKPRSLDTVSVSSVSSISTTHKSCAIEGRDLHLKSLDFPDFIWLLENVSEKVKKEYSKAHDGLFNVIVINPPERVLASILRHLFI